MRLGLVADVHCNTAALQQAVDELGSDVDEILVAGDALFDYRFSNETLECIREHELRYVVGNHELGLLGKDGERARAAPTVRAENLEFLTNVPTRLEATVGGKRLLMVHASPWAPYNQYLMPSSPELDRCDELDVDILVLGHTHLPMAVRRGRTLVVNPGSLGHSREKDHRGSVTYGILDTESGELEVRRFENPLLAVT